MTVPGVSSANGQDFDLNIEPDTARVEALVVTEGGEALVDTTIGEVSAENEKRIDDDPFELEPIIEAVMKENNSRKRSFHDVESTVPGIEGNLTVDILLKLNRLHTPDIVILLETKNKSSRYVFLKMNLGLEYMFAVESKGLSGGLCVFWRDGSQVTLLKSEEFMIAVKIWDENLNKQ
ncbi:hypothetical protein ACFX19_002872 [Malus domestica]